MICSRCGFSDNDILPQLYCSSCGTIYSSEPKKFINQHETPLWETSYARDFPFTSYFKTVKEIFLSPDHFFQQISPIHQVLTAMFFALISGSIGYTFYFLWSQLFPEQLSTIYNETESFFTSKESSSATSLLFTPILVTFQIIAIASYTHFMLIITRTRKNPFVSTLKIVSYAQCALLLNIVPFIGSFFSAVCMFLLLLTGIKHKNEISKPKAFLILITPILIAIAFLLAVVILLVLLGIAASGLIENSIPFFK